ncbi:MAG TPA: hypothetical protein VKO43_09255 [Candidatus Krumholzibacteriaceae bacterium]|nr:hypothetical protein [Candidatus Krumholzibacteriaceae bacterium]
MKRLIVFLVALIVALPVFAGERVTKIVESEIPVILDGNWIYPVNGRHTLVLTDSVLTINGYEYVHPPKKIEKHVISKEKNFSEWVIHTASEQGQKVIDEGGAMEDAFVVMKEFFEEHLAGNDSIQYDYSEYRDGFNITNTGIRAYKFIVTVPRISTKVMMEGRPTWRKKAVEGECSTLISVLKSGRLLFKNTQDNYGRGFNPEQAIPAIKKVQKERLKYMEAARDTSVWVNGIKFSPIDIKILTNPAKLVKRRFEDESD